MKLLHWAGAGLGIIAVGAALWLWDPLPATPATEELAAEARLYQAEIIRDSWGRAAYFRPNGMQMLRSALPMPMQKRIFRPFRKALPPPGVCWPAIKGRRSAYGLSGGTLQCLGCHRRKI